MNEPKKQSGKIALIAPQESNPEDCSGFLSGAPGYEMDHYPSLAAFRAKISDTPPHYAGYIIDLRCLIKADNADKESFYRLMETRPVMRIAPTRDGSGFTGNISGKTLKDRELFTFFLEQLALRESETRKRRIAVFAANPASLDLYSRALEPFRETFQTECYSSGSAGFLEDLAGDPHRLYNGFIIDLRTLLKAESKDKDFYYEILNSFPALRVSHSPDGGVIKGNFRNLTYENRELFQFFLEDVCGRFAGRGVRLAARRPLFLNMLVHPPAPDGDPSPAPWPANTLNISANGLFVAATRPVRKGETLQLTPRDLSDQQPIEILVKWTLPWGETIRSLPGFGGAFTRISSRQREELAELFKKPAAAPLS